MYNSYINHSAKAHEKHMQNILLGTLMFLLAFPGMALAASGPAGTVETLSASVFSSFVTADVRASAQTSVSQTKLYIEYGQTPELGLRSSGKNIRQGAASIVVTRLFFLTPGVTYYYRATLEGTSGTVYGEMLTFQTKDQGSATTAG